MADANTIHLSGGFTRKEGIPGETITPGKLVEIYNASGTEKVRKHNSSGGFVNPAFAIEDPLQGKSLTSIENRTIDDDYTTSDGRMQYNIAHRGAKVQAWLKSGENVVIGDNLISGGDGTLIKTTGSPKTVVAKALEALDISDSDDEDTRINVEIL